MNPEEINRESLNKLNIKTLALNKDKFGVLTFDESFPLLEKIQKLFIELDELDYKGNLSQSEINQVDQYLEQFLNHLRQLASFDLATGFNRDVHDGFENNIRGFYDEVFRNLRNILVYLRQETASKSQDVKELQKQQKAAVQAEKEYKTLADKLKQQLNVLEKREQEVETKHGEIAVKLLGEHFAKETNNYSKEAGNWFKTRKTFYTALLIIVSVHYAIYMLSRLGILPLSLDRFYTIEYGVLALSVITMLWYGLRFTTQNFNITSNLESINRHRKNVAQTLEDFLATNPDPETRTQMIKQGTEAMFKHFPSGYVNKNPQGENHPIYEVINNFLKPGGN
ncbi:MAG: hypothetical protein M1405_00470 [Patescibacteria group bacterium]|nr:hypothetical protein [Patescibacteria group bacterium]